ncbi:MAG: sugar ABC transporter substrate-binding protein [Candidatus Margulisbacteria bacterium]|nr:sugar ABC transporter substrate-binding protein [Candidatus Margulisiibacteriota bacterium]
MKIKIIIPSLLIASLLIVSLFSGCAPKKKDDGKTVQMWVMPNSVEPVADLERLLKPFEEETGIKVVITSVDWGAAWSKITTAATSGDVPDLVQVGSTWVSAISGMGALEPFSKEAIAELGGEKTFVPVAWTTSGIENSGQTTAIPWIVDARALYYRQDVLKKARVSPDQLNDWQSFKLALGKIYNADIVIEDQSIAPIGISGKNDWNVIHSLAPWIWMAGGEFLGPDRKTCLLDSDEVFNGISFYISLVRDEYVPIEYLELNTAQVSGNFNDGACGMYFDGPYEVKTLTRPVAEGGAAGSMTSRNFAVTGYPKGPKGRVTFVGGSNLSIFKNAKNKAGAFKVIQYLTAKKQQIAYAKVSGFLPARRDAFDDPFFTEDPNRKVFKDAVFYGRTYPPVPSWGLLEPILTRRLGIMWDYVTSNSDYDPSKIRNQLKLAKKEVEAILNQ